MRQEPSQILRNRRHSIPCRFGRRAHGEAPKLVSRQKVWEKSWAGAFTVVSMGRYN